MPFIPRKPVHCRSAFGRRASSWGGATTATQEMSDLGAGHDVPVVRSDPTEHPVLSVWRPVFCEVVRAFVERDYRLGAGIPGVAPVAPDTAEQIEEYIRAYAEVLVPLPEATWETSVSIWMGDHWDVLVDLWTEREGRSDMVLAAQVSETASGFAFQVNLVYVP